MSTGRGLAILTKKSASSMQVQRKTAGASGRDAPAMPGAAPIWRQSSPCCRMELRMGEWTSPVTRSRRCSTAEPTRLEGVPCCALPGTYVLVCNLPGHYKSGMHQALEVK